MIAIRIERSTRYLGAPPNWEPDRDGHCGHLAVRDEQFSAGQWCMISAWEPTPQELERLAAGAPIHLVVVGGIHPPVGLIVGPVPELSA